MFEKARRYKTARHPCQKDPVPARPVSQEATEGPRQQGLQKGRLGPAVPHREADFMPLGGRICSGRAGRVVLHARYREGPQVPSAREQADPRTVHRKPQERRMRPTREGWRAVLTHVQPVQCPRVHTAPERATEVFCKGHDDHRGLRRADQNPSGGFCSGTRTS